MSCRQTRRLLGVRREWTAREQAQVQHHLGGCSVCQAVAREYELMDRRLDRLPEPVVLGAMPASARTWSIVKEKTTSSETSSWSRQVLRGAALAVLVLLIAAASLVWQSGPGLPFEAGDLAALVPADWFEQANTPTGSQVSPDDFVWPTTGELSQAYSGDHPGLDIKNYTGTPVYAVAEGLSTVVGLGNTAYGNHVLLDHGGGYSTFYAHLDAVDVQSGDRVDKGQQIGEMGSTGRSTGPHLHFEIRLEGIAQNPLEIVPVEEWLENLSVDSQALAAAHLVWPTEGRLSQDFSTEHLAVDLAARSGTPVYVAAGGRVAGMGQNERDGNYVLLDHGDGLTTFYSHLRAIHVREGESVDRGQQIGEVGSTGYSTGPHLHFAIHKDGVPVDPLDVLP